ncbi:MAG: DHH family phosphoesterase, partial [Prevotella sp.]|nr:DHH family phosphoesterase [Prevotella sp.]
MQILTDAEISHLKKILASVHKIVVCCHKSPDGDAVGSSLAWAEYLTQQGKQVQVVLPDAAPDFLHWLPGFDTMVMRHDKKPENVRQVFDEAELICCLDFNTSSRVEFLQPVLDACTAPKILIDHHLQPDIETVLTVSKPQMS